jgi:hypothetical protein
MLVLLVVLFTSATINAQITYDGGGIGKGIRFKTDDNSFYLKFRTRAQVRWEFDNIPESDYYVNKGQVKRARLKFDGYFINENLRYKIEYDVVRGYVRDAVIKYKTGSVDLWFGQAKLPGNRERVTSSANLQTIDRSIFNAGYNLDRDLGFQLHHSFNIGKVFVRDMYAITSGNGIKDIKKSSGVNLTAKFEVQPLGKFKSKNDYKGSDIYREETPKIAIAVYGNYNMGSNKTKGTVGLPVLDREADLLNYGGDITFKYSGFSVLAEVGTREVTDGEAILYDPSTGDVVNSFYSGFGANIQSGYVFKNNWEVLGRYAFTNPTNIDIGRDITDYTLGVNKFIVGHSFKLQADVTYRQIEGKNDMYIGRLQLEFQF